MPRESMERSRESTVNLLVTFQSAGVRQAREASRISFDGKGGLIVYGGEQREERLPLNRVCGLRIIPVQPSGTKSPAGNVAIPAYTLQ